MKLILLVAATAVFSSLALGSVAERGKVCFKDKGTSTEPIHDHALAYQQWPLLTQGIELKDEDPLLHDEKTNRHYVLWYGREWKDFCHGVFFFDDTALAFLTEHHDVFTQRQLDFLHGLADGAYSYSYEMDHWFSMKGNLMTSMAFGPLSALPLAHRVIHFLQWEKNQKRNFLNKNSGIKRTTIMMVHQ